MIIDTQAPDPTFVSGPLPAVDLEELLEWARRALALGPERPWRLISARRKLGKPLFEVEEETPEGPRRIIGKIARPGRAATLFAALRQLWDAGFHPPAEFTVVRPIAHLPERDLILQERAPGKELLLKIVGKEPDAGDGIRKTAQWLAHLHRQPLQAARWKESPDRWIGWSRELQSKAPWAARRIAALEERTREFLGSRGDAGLVPAHGDFHPMNMFLSPGRLTAIDIDKFGLRERVDEVGYCLGQTAFMCDMRGAGRDAGRAVRERFLAEYEAAAGEPLDRLALGGFMAATVIKNLHFTLVAYEERRFEIVDPWLAAAEAWLAGRVLADA